jgi:hypothetical protein
MKTFRGLLPSAILFDRNRRGQRTICEDLIEREFIRTGKTSKKQIAIRFSIGLFLLMPISAAYADIASKEYVIRQNEQKQDLLPPQAGNADKVLVTDGTNMSWGTKNTWTKKPDTATAREYSAQNPNEVVYVTE